MRVKPYYRFAIYNTKELRGLTGDNDEEYCLFIRNGMSPLNSSWAWYATKEEAEKKMEEYLKRYERMKNDEKTNQKPL